MNESRIVVAQFCDDIRQEVGNKHSLMGCYGDEIIFETLPAVLPKLCIKVQAITPRDHPFERLNIKAFLNSDMLAEMEVPPEQLAIGRKLVEKRTNSKRLSVIVMLVLAPLVISESTMLRIEAETEEGKIEGSKVNIRERDREPITEVPVKS